MSGVAKDDTNPNSPKDETVPVPGETEAAGVDPQAIAPAIVPPREESEPRGRRTAPHLRVVTDEDLPSAEPPARIGDVIRLARENKGFSLEQVSRDTRVHMSHLRAIEDMRPGLLGAPVYAKGYIKSYARFLGMDEQGTLDRFLSECAAILKDPEKPEVVVTASSKSRRLPVAVPMLGILVVALVGGGIAIMVSGGKKPPAVVAEAPVAGAATGPVVEVATPQLRIIALKAGHLTVRSSKGDKYVDRVYEAGGSFIVRVGAGFTVSVDDGSAFEWRLGDQSLGLLQAGGGPVYSQNVDLAAQRQPIVVEAPPAAPETISAATGLTANGDPLPANPAPAAAAPAPAPVKPKPPKPQPTPGPILNTTPVVQAPPPPPIVDPALAAYPDQAPAPVPSGQ